MAVFAKSDVPQFAVDIYQNEYLPEGGREVNAIVTVTAAGGGTLGGLPLGAPGPTSTPAPDAAVVIMVDCSGSMDNPPTKMRNAREATAVAIDTIRDGVAFAVIAGTHAAYEVYPADGGLAVADPATRHQAKQAVGKLAADGGTAIGGWLWLADELLATVDVPIRHGILLTDGRNEHEAPGALRAVLDACAGRFTCDARGVGTDWEVKELTDVASALLGSVDIVADPSGLAEDFRLMMENAMGKGVADVALRVWTPQGTEVKWVKQVAPTLEDLTLRRTDTGPRAGDYPTGSWGDESRDYHVCIRSPARRSARKCWPPGSPSWSPSPTERRRWSPRASYVPAGPTTWPPPPASTPRSPTTPGRPNSPRSSSRAWKPASRATSTSATAKLGRAVQLADSSGNDDTAKLLAKVVDVVDAASGTVRLKARVANADEMTLETRSTKTVRASRDSARHAHRGREKEHHADLPEGSPVRHRRLVRGVRPPHVLRTGSPPPLRGRSGTRRSPPPSPAPTAARPATASPSSARGAATTSSLAPARSSPPSHRPFHRRQSRPFPSRLLVQSPAVHQGSSPSQSSLAPRRQGQPSHGSPSGSTPRCATP
jgi:hypothetical protein